MFAKTGEATEPCGVPRRLSRHSPSSMTPAFNHLMMSLITRLSAMRCSRNWTSQFLDTLSKNARMSQSTTQLRSLVNHRDGLSVFLDRPEVPMDNNLAERVLRGPAIGRRLSFGSDSATGARFTALMYSVVGTLNLNGIDVLRWLEEWLAACAANGRRPPEDLSPWLPWSMSEERKRSFTAPG